MRESIGGAWLFGIVIVFIFLFSAFLTYSINYTKAFNVKNEVINYIEHAQGLTKYVGSANGCENETDPQVLNSNVQCKIYTLIMNTGYDYDGVRDCKDGAENFYGVCISKICPVSDEDVHNKSNTHYKITTYITLEIPIIGAKISIPITGETASIFQDNGGYQCLDDVLKAEG